MLTNLKVAVDRKRRERQKEKVEKLHAQGIWVTREGQYIPIHELDDEHLVNIVRLLHRRATNYVIKTRRFYLSCAEPRGEMAQVAFDQEFEYWCGDGDPEWDFLNRQPVWPHLAKEMARRGLT